MTEMRTGCAAVLVWAAASKALAAPPANLEGPGAVERVLTARLDQIASGQVEAEWREAKSREGGAETHLRMWSDAFDRAIQSDPESERMIPALYQQAGLLSVLDEWERLIDLYVELAVLEPRDARKVDALGFAVSAAYALSCESPRAVEPVRQMAQLLGAAMDLHEQSVYTNAEERSRNARTLGGFGVEFFFSTRRAGGRVVGGLSPEEVRDVGELILRGARLVESDCTPADREWLRQHACPLGRTLGDAAKVLVLGGDAERAMEVFDRVCALEPAERFEEEPLPVRLERLAAAWDKADYERFVERLVSRLEDREVEKAVLMVRLARSLADGERAARLYEDAFRIASGPQATGYVPAWVPAANAARGLSEYHLHRQDTARSREWLERARALEATEERSLQPNGDREGESGVLRGAHGGGVS